MVCTNQNQRFACAAGQLVPDGSILKPLTHIGIQDESENLDF
jgi:hypothetical protein